MYINAKERKNKKDVKVYYVYLCESMRVNGKVKNIQRYVGSISEITLAEKDYSFIDGKDLTEQEKEIVLSKLNQMARQVQ